MLVYFSMWYTAPLNNPHVIVVGVCWVNPCEYEVRSYPWIMDVTLLPDLCVYLCACLNVRKEQR
jgi:hypothetical protein